MNNHIDRSDELLSLLTESFIDISSINENKTINATNILQKFNKNILKICKDFLYRTTVFVNDTAKVAYSKNKDNLNEYVYRKSNVNFYTDNTVKDICLRGSIILNRFHAEIIELSKTPNNITASEIIKKILPAESTDNPILDLQNYIFNSTTVKNEPLNKYMWEDIANPKNFYNKIIDDVTKNISMPLTDLYSKLKEKTNNPKEYNALTYLIISIINACYIVTDTLFKNIVKSISVSFNYFKTALELSINTVK